MTNQLCLPPPRTIALLPATCPVMKSPFSDGYWLGVQDGDSRAFALYSRHYSARQYRRQRTNRLFVGPGEKMVLLTYQCDALFVWRKFIDDSGQLGVNCAVFRNEGPVLSSTLIREAMQLAWKRWPGERLYTYVHPGKIRSTNPGYCYLKAGWQKCGTTKGGLTILEVYPYMAVAVPTGPIKGKSIPEPKIVVTTAIGSFAVVGEYDVGAALAELTQLQQMTLLAG